MLHSKVIKSMDLRKAWDIYNKLVTMGFYTGQHQGPTLETKGAVVLAPQVTDGTNPKFPAVVRTGVAAKVQSCFLRLILQIVFMFSQKRFSMFSVSFSECERCLSQPKVFHVFPEKVFHVFNFFSLVMQDQTARANASATFTA